MLLLRLQSAARYLLPSPLPEHLQRQTSRAEAQPARAQPAEEAKSTLPHGVCSHAPAGVSRAPAGSASMRTTYRPWQRQRRLSHPPPRHRGVYEKIYPFQCTKIPLPEARPSGRVTVST